MNLSLTRDPIENTRLLQKALDKGGTIQVEGSGIYDVEGPLFISSDTTLKFEEGIKIRRSSGGESKPFLLNRGIFTGEWNERIRIEGLHLIVNGVDLTHHAVYSGLRGHLAFLKVRDLVIRDYECCNLLLLGYGLHICSFENILLEKIHIEGDKDGIHLSDGRTFIIRDSIFRTYDDAIALNAYDYCLSTAVYGDVEDGLIENCHDLDGGDHKAAGYFCRMLGGSWQDWYEGMEVQNSTLAVHNGHLYSVCLPVPPQAAKVVSKTPPVHKFGIAYYDGIPWRHVREHRGDYEATCRRITCRNIRLGKPRIGFGFTFSWGIWAESVPEGLKMPVLEDLVFDGIHTECKVAAVLGGCFPAKNVKVSNSTLQGKILLSQRYPKCRLEDHPVTDITFSNVHIPQSGKEFFYETPERGPFRITLIDCSGEGFEGVPTE